MSDLVLGIPAFISAVMAAVKGRLVKIQAYDDGERGHIVFALIVCIGMAGGYLYLHQEWITSADLWHAQRKMGHGLTLMALLWCGLMAYYTLLNMILRDHFFCRVGQLARGYKARVDASADVRWFGSFAVVLLVLAYCLDGRLNSSFAGGLLSAAVVYYAITFWLYFPAVAAAFVAVTAYKVCSFPERAWN